MKHAIPACSFLFGVFVVWITGSTGTFISNLSESCYNCLCYAHTMCDSSHGCAGGYCGPFNISHVYWVDSGKVVLPNDDPNRNLAWRDCARNFICSKRIVEGYLERFGKDCNSDGVTNCLDYLMVNIHGRYGCKTPLNQSEPGRLTLQRYEYCRLQRA